MLSRRRRSSGAPSYRERKQLLTPGSGHARRGRASSRRRASQTFTLAVAFGVVLAAVIPSVGLSLPWDGASDHVALQGADPAEVAPTEEPEPTPSPTATATPSPSSTPTATPTATLEPADDVYAIEVVVDDEDTSRFRTMADHVEGFLSGVGIKTGEFDRVEPAMDAALEDGMTIAISTADLVEDVTTLPIDFATERVENDELPEGEEREAQTGQDGELTRTEQIAYLDGEEVGRTVIAEDVTVDPTPRVVESGTGLAVAAAEEPAEPTEEPVEEEPIEEEPEEPAEPADEGREAAEEEPEPEPTEEPEPEPTATATPTPTPTATAEPTEEPEPEPTEEPEPEPEPTEEPEPEPEPTEEPEPEPEPTEEPVDDESVWDELAQCESGGDWSINTGNGYYGGLQFLLSTWQAYGGSGYPHENTREEQIRVAIQLRDASGGYSPWPACAEQLGLPR